jgi:hypothetical protein
MRTMNTKSRLMVSALLAAGLSLSGLAGASASGAATPSTGHHHHHDGAVVVCVVSRATKDGSRTVALPRLSYLVALKKREDGIARFMIRLKAATSADVTTTTCH